MLATIFMYFVLGLLAITFGDIIYRTYIKKEKKK
jgi:hypothetical protein